MKVVGVIQARLGSTRLPYKMMLSLHGRPVVEWAIERTKTARLLDGVIAAIPSSSENDILEKHIRSLNVSVYRGSEEDVLGRFCEAARLQKATHVVRICADNPLISGEEIDRLIAFYRQHLCDYAYNHIPRGNSYPDGLGAEMVSYEILERLQQSVSATHYREHCLSYIVDHPKEFSIRTFDPSDERIAYPDIRLEIDTFSDYYRLSLMDFSIDTAAHEVVKIFRESAQPFNT